MSDYMRRLKEDFLVVERGLADAKGSLPNQLIWGGNTSKLSRLQTPYIDATRSYFNKNELEGGRRLILATDDRNMAMKTAILISSMEDYEEDEQEWAWDSYDEEFDDYDNDGKLVYVDFPFYDGGEKTEMLMQTIVARINTSGFSHILFTGAQEIGDWRMVFNSLVMCELPYQYIQISPKMLGNPVVQRIIYERGYRVLRLPELKEDYYVNVMEKLLKESECTLSKECNIGQLVKGLMKKRGAFMCEEDVATFLDMGTEAALEAGREKLLKPEDFNTLVTIEKASAWDTLNKLTGLDEVKQAAKELLAVSLEQMNNKELKCGREHMVFYGKPGTGKTTCAKLMARLLEEEGCGNGSFVVATRKDIIGKYVGHTAHQVAKCFDQARGGVLFVDEAGFFLNEGSGGFVQEAIKEFVRYMEELDDVTVIFAMYPDEAKAFYDLDPGLTSRVKRNVEFKDYSVDELKCIAIDMFEDNGYKVDKNAISLIYEYIHRTKAKEKESFGNARTMRKLVDMGIKELSLRHYMSKSRKASTKNNRILASDIRAAIDKLGEVKVERRVIGFVNDSMNKVICKEG